MLHQAKGEKLPSNKEGKEKVVVYDVPSTEELKEECVELSEHQQEGEVVPSTEEPKEKCVVTDQQAKVEISLQREEKKQETAGDKVPSMKKEEGRRVEQGMLRRPGKVVAMVEFEVYPDWLLALDQSCCEGIYLVDCKDSSDLLRQLVARGRDTTLINKSLSLFGLEKVFYGRPPQEAEWVRLVSGSLNFLKERAVTELNRRSLFVCSEDWRGRTPKTAKTGVVWSRRGHSSFGGCTNFQVLFGARGFNCAPKSTNLTRFLGHIIDHGCREHDSSLLMAQCLGGDSLLDVHKLDRPVCYRSKMVKDGWMTRCLTPDELGIGFGLVADLRGEELTRTMFPFVPVQILDGLLEAISPSKIVITEPLATPRVTKRAPIPLATWLPALKCHLNHSWVDEGTVSAKAVKSDDADVPTHLWDRRITLIFTQAGSKLGWFRRKVMTRFKQRLYKEFAEYMRNQHGHEWLRRLTDLRRRLCSRNLESQRRGGLKDVKRGLDAPNSNLNSKPRGRERDRDRVPLSSLDLELLRDAKAGSDALSKICSASWWGWDMGSTLLFWRWPEGEQRTAARDGMKAYISNRLPHYTPRKRPPKKEIFELLLPKIAKVLRRGYVVSNHDPESYLELEDFIESYIDYFGVPKGEDDIRVVYNGTSSGLNEVVWAPNFWLPTPKTASRVLNYDYCGVDVDMGDFFLNFPLPEIFRRFSGIDISDFHSSLDGFKDVPYGKLKARWERCWMGFRPSPYYAIRFYYWGEEFARGDRRSKKNPMRWDRIRLNLPGSKDFDPTLPRAMKWNEEIKNIAADLAAFVDDLRVSGLDEEIAWRAARQIVARLQYLGMQDAPRKRRPPVRKTGAWAGSVFSTTDEKITQTVTPEKWAKAKRLLAELRCDFDKAGGEFVNYKQMERIRGYLCHLSMTFEVITPFLKGFHMTLCNHLPQRDDEGWKLTDRAWAAFIKTKEEEEEMTEEEARKALHPPEFKDIPIPISARPVPRFKDDLRALELLLKPDVAPEVVVRAKRIFELIYGFADASGKGLGGTALIRDGIRVRIGLWESEAEEESSNWREFENVVEELEELGEQGHLQDAMVFFFTDNSTVEYALYKGSSSSPLLFDKIIRFRALETKYNVKILVSHVAGERMKAQGTDGVSRGHLKEGVAAGLPMLSFIPLNKSALDREPSLKIWLRSWLGPETEFLTPEGWYERGHDHLGGRIDSRKFWWPNIKSGTFVWSPPPGAAAVALEELRKARIKHQDSTHVFVCPRLLTPEWRKQLFKAADIVFEIPAGSEFWGKKMFEPLIIGILFPFISSFPWQLRGTPKMHAVGRDLLKVFNHEQDVDSGSFLRKFLLECRRLSTVSEDVVPRVLYFERRSPISHQSAKRGRSRGKGSQRRSKSPTTLGSESKKQRRFH